MSAITGWTIGQRRSGKFSARLWWRVANGKRQSAYILGPDGDDALFDTEMEAIKAARLFERNSPTQLVIEKAA